MSAVVATSAANLVGDVVQVVLAVAIAVASTVLSLRLLGVRRGWPMALVAGLVGWGVALALALALADEAESTENRLLHTLAIGVPTTMAVAVSFDLLARPGSLASAERAGLVVAPRPLTALRRRIDVARRYSELLRLFRSEGFGPMLTAREKATGAAAPPGVRLRRVFEQAGGVYVKLGQIAATRIDLLPVDVCEELSNLQNRATPERADRIRPVLEAELGAGVDEVFDEFDWEPLAAGSIAQTYAARLRSGEPVVVKVQRPGVDEVVERDLAALALLADFAQRRTPLGRGVRSGDALSQFATSLRAELDFRREADAMGEMAGLLGDASGVSIPRVYADLCTRRLLVQERFDGFTVADSRELATSGADRRALADQLLGSWLDQVLRLGFFHADPHPGNVFVVRDGSLGLIDFGAVGRLDVLQQSAMRDLLAGFVVSDIALLRDAVERLADVSGEVPAEQLERALARLLLEHARPGGVIEPMVVQDLVTLLARFGMRLPGDLVVLSRALVTIEGTLRVLVPDYSLFSGSMEVLRGPSTAPVLEPGAAVQAELLSALPHLRHLPDRIDRVLTLAGRGELRLRTVTSEDRDRLVRTLVNRGLLAGTGSAFLLVAAVLLVATDEGPAVATDTGLFEIFGYGGLVIGTVLLLRVVAAVARDGTA